MSAFNLPESFNHIGVLFTVPRLEDEKTTMARHHAMLSPFGYSGQPYALEQGHMIRGGHKLLPLELVDGGVNKDKRTNGWRMTKEGIEISVENPGYAEDTLDFFQKVLPLAANKAPKILFVQSARSECADWHLGLHFLSYEDMESFVEHLKMQGNPLAFEFAANYVPRKKDKHRQKSAVFKVPLHGVTIEMSFGRGGPPHEMRNDHKRSFIGEEDVGTTAYSKHAPVGGKHDHIPDSSKGGKRIRTSENLF